MTLSARARVLIDRYLDDVLSPDETAELEGLLQTEPAAAAAFVRAARLESALRDELSTDGDAAALAALFRREEAAAPMAVVPLPPPVRADHAPLWADWSRVVPTLVIVAAAVLIGWTIFAPRSEESPPTAKVVSGRVSVAGATDAASGEIPLDRPFEVLGRENAAIQLSDGSRMTARPESRAILHRPEGEVRQRVELQRGQATFAVEKAPGSFRVETGAMRLIVAGTEFTVRVIPAVAAGERRSPERAEISVASGKVVVDPQEGETIVLTAGQKRVFPGERREVPRPKERDGEERRERPDAQPRREEREPPRREEPRREIPPREEERREEFRREEIRREESRQEASRREGTARREGQRSDLERSNPQPRGRK